MGELVGYHVCWLGYAMAMAMAFWRSEAVALLGVSSSLPYLRYLLGVCARVQGQRGVIARMGFAT